MTTTDLPNIDLDALIVGAGFSGLYQLHKLRKAGFSVKIFEAASAVGGAWYWNCYPGCRTDSNSEVYQFSLQDVWEDWTWKERFSGQKEISAYFSYVEKKLDLTRDILFNTRVTGASFDQSDNRWVVSTDSGVTARPRFLILCTGFASKPLFPEFKGLDTFQGAIHHTGLWPQEGVEMKGKRIGIIGTGASGVQVIQETGPDAAHLTVFQRTPNMAFPMRQRPVDEDTEKRTKDSLYPIIFRRRDQTFAGFTSDFNFKDIHRTTAEERRMHYEDIWAKGGPSFWSENYFSAFEDEALNNEVYDFWKMKVRERIANPEMQRKLAPDIAPHPFGVKRPSLEINYYEVYNLPHVTLIDLGENPISEITPKGVKTADGVEHELDVLVLATGFDMVTGSISQIAIQGTDGVKIGDRLKEGIQTYLGLGSTNFPNMFFICGPHGPSDLCNAPTCSEIQGNWISDCLQYMRQCGVWRIEATEKAQREFSAMVNQLFASGLWLKARSSSYTGGNVPGKKIESLNFAGGIPLYAKLCRESAENGYKGFAFSGGARKAWSSLAPLNALNGLLKSALGVVNPLHSLNLWFSYLYRSFI